jgi:hypothetical protein
MFNNNFFLKRVVLCQYKITYFLITAGGFSGIFSQLWICEKLHGFIFSNCSRTLMLLLLTLPDCSKA